MSADKAPKLRSSELSTEDLATIRDNTYFRTAEKEAWFTLIGLLQQTPANELADKSVGEVGYVQLVQQPNVYRGKVVNVRGTVRQVTLEKPAANELGVDSVLPACRAAERRRHLADLCVLPRSAGRFSAGRRRRSRCFSDRILLQELSYEWQDGLGLAPVVLVNEVTRVDAAAAGDQAAPIHAPTIADAWKDSDVKEKAADESATRGIWPKYCRWPGGMPSGLPSLWMASHSRRSNCQSFSRCCGG